MEDTVIPRSGAGIYSKAVGTTAVANTVIQSAQFNGAIDDLVEDANTARPLTAGGTGAASAADARTNLQLGTMALQDKDAVNIDGGAIDSTTIGAGTPGAGTFTDLYATGDLTADTATFTELSAAGINFNAIAAAYSTTSGNAHVARATTGNPLGSNGHLILQSDPISDRSVVFVTGSTPVERLRVATDVITSALPLSVGPDGVLDPADATYGVSMSVDGRTVISRLADTPLRVKRSDDGTLVQWYSGVTSIGSISSSAGTVTYGAFCGAHWSQGNIAKSILPGTILETIDEMCVWPGESNRTLPKVRIAEAGSRSVYGVFSHWDDDGSADFHVASLGALYVRMAPGQAPIRGDLIESAGGGSGRVQADDTFKSSTIGKVTSAQVVETYPDGSFLVPVTLHCG